MSSSATTTPTTTLNAGVSAGVGIALSVTMILSFFIFFVSGSFLAVIVFWLVLILSVVILVTYGYLPTTSLFVKPSTPAPAAAPQTQDSGNGLVGMEVFHVDNSTFTYDDAPAACAAFGASLATLEQVNEAYNDGAEWCGYGWSAGGLALFPTQRATWEGLQQEVDPAKRTACGRVGVNGGYFDPSSKFGVNCYGYKPAATKKMTFPTPPPGADSTAFQAAVNKFQGMLSSFTVSPYSRQQWSGYGALGSNATAAANYGTQFTQNVGALGGTSVTTKETFVENLGVSASDANMLDANRPGGYTYIHSPAYVGAPGMTGGGGAAWHMNNRPDDDDKPKRWAGHGASCDCVACAGGIGPTGPAGPMGLMGPVGPIGPTGPKAPSAAGSSVANAAPVAPTAPYVPTPLEKIFLDFAFQNVPVPAGTQVTASDVSQVKAKSAARPVQSPDRYAIDIVANAMENYRVSH